MKDLRRRFNRFCFANRDKGIANLMLYVSVGTAIVYFMGMMDDSLTLYRWLCFDRGAILQGQIWRLVTFPLCYSAGNLLWTALSLLCYYSLGTAIENLWGTFRFNLFYAMGMVLMDVYCLLFGGEADAFYLNTSLFLSYATLYPNAQFTLFFIIPVKAWILAVFDLALMLPGLFLPFPYGLFPVIALGNYFLFFGKDVVNLFPMTWQVKLQRSVGKKATQVRKTIPFRQDAKPGYNHKCTVCGRTDVSDPELEFRYCSKCNGYYCYCQEHIGNHTHVE